MLEKSLNPEAVDHIMIIYKKTPPLLTSKKSHNRINQEIIGLLKGDWTDLLSEADRQATQILEEKNLERQKRKQKVEDIAVDMIIGGNILADSIQNRFRR